MICGTGSERGKEAGAMFLPQNTFQADVTTKKPLRASERPARASLPPSFCGSMTLEAAIAVPLFLFFVMNLLFVFEAVRLQSGLQAAVQQAGEQVCEAAYYTRFGASQGQSAPDTSGSSEEPALNGEAVSLLLSETYVRNKVSTYLGDAFWRHSCVVGGRAGLSFLGSGIMTEGDRVEIVVSCRVRPFIRILGFPDFPMQVRYCGHAWVGWEHGGGTVSGGGTGNDDTVYVTKYGEVYHRDPGCIYLNPQIREIPASEVSKYRSGNGAMYYPCECCKPGKNGTVYITKEGNRYHSDRNCSGIVRNTQTMDSTAATSHYRPCPKCGGQH